MRSLLVVAAGALCVHAHVLGFVRAVPTRHNQSGVLRGVPVRALLPSPLHIHGRGAVVLAHGACRVSEGFRGAVGVVLGPVQHVALRLVVVAGTLHVLWFRVHAQEVEAPSLV